MGMRAIILYWSSAGWRGLTPQSDHPPTPTPTPPNQLCQQSMHCILRRGSCKGLIMVRELLFSSLVQDPIPKWASLDVHQPFCWCRTKDHKGEGREDEDGIHPSFPCSASCPPHFCPVHFSTSPTCSSHQPSPTLAYLYSIEKLAVAVGCWPCCHLWLPFQNRTASTAMWPFTKVEPLS